MTGDKDKQRVYQSQSDSRDGTADVVQSSWRQSRGVPDMADKGKDQ